MMNQTVQHHMDHKMKNLKKIEMNQENKKKKVKDHCDWNSDQVQLKYNWKLQELADSCQTDKADK